MLENYEFWSLLFTILGGDVAILFITAQMKNEITAVKTENMTLKSNIDLEFAKCRLHGCNNTKEVKQNE